MTRYELSESAERFSGSSLEAERDARLSRQLTLRRQLRSERYQCRHRRIHPVLQYLPSAAHCSDSELHTAADLSGSPSRFSKSVAMQELTATHENVWVWAATQPCESDLNVQKAIAGLLSHSIGTRHDRL
jgi:hypothetical protein